MKDERIDVPLSKQVAKEASNQINRLNDELNDNKDSYIFFLKDMLGDSKGNVAFFKKVITALFVTVMLLIVGMVGLSVYSQREMKKLSQESNAALMDFINSCDICSEIELMNENSNDNYNSLNVNK